MTERHVESQAAERRTPRIYLAGPDVFLPDAIEQGKRKKAICQKYHLGGVFPFDNELQAENLSPRNTGLEISKANEELISGCDAIIANMTPFRGPSADVGTAYEMGFGRALGLPVFAYTNVSAAFAQRVCQMFDHKVVREGDNLRDPSGMSIEQFDLADNLMLEGGIDASGGKFMAFDAPAGELFTWLVGFEECVKAASSVLLSGSHLR